MDSSFLVSLIARTSSESGGFKRFVISCRRIAGNQQFAVSSFHQSPAAERMCMEIMDFCRCFAYLLFVQSKPVKWNFVMELCNSYLVMYI